MDKGYAIIYAYTTNSTTTFLDPFEGIYVIFLPYGRVFELFKPGPIVLYQFQIPGLNVFALSYDITYAGIGQTCILNVKRSLTTPKEIPDTFYVKIDFLSSRVVHNVTLLNGTISTNPEIQYSIRSLRYGGYLLSGIGKNDAGKTIIYGYIFDDNGKIDSWNFTNPIDTNFIAASIILPNNTFVLAQSEKERNWTLITTDLYRFAQEQGKVT